MVCKCECGRLATLYNGDVWKCGCGRTWRLLFDDAFKATLEFLGIRKKETS